MWDRWPRGESLNSIGPAFDRPSSSIFSQLAPSGGIRPPIRQRAPSMEDRAVAGHWEGDLSKNSYMATLVEGHSRYVMLAKVDNKESQTVVSALIKHAQKLSKELYKSLTWD